MGRTIIKVENVSKQYRLGQLGTGSFATDINRWWYTVRGKEDPYLRIGEENDRTKKGNDTHVWALQGVSFDVKQGDVLGIIGRNGAGKSTLLKILSRTTSPTTGSVKVKGRIASLLEVGTGFHPELSGKENIFLNGAILGMSKSEIKSKFDEIVDFSGVEKYIDTPVKRYSSGMYVRLAFAVAAHLEPEILIVDEVLAVGDLEFQKKCLGKMKEVSGEGRTVLFVSHNMQSVSTLTSKCFVMSKGRMSFEGKTSDAIAEYLSEGAPQNLIYEAFPSVDKPVVTRVHLKTSLPNNTHVNGEELEIHFEVNTPYALRNAAISFQVMNRFDTPIMHLWVFDSQNNFCRTAGIYNLICRIPKAHLYMGRYTLKIHFSETETSKKFETIESICPFEIVMYGKERDYVWTEGTCTYIEDCIWEVKKSLA